MQQYWLLKNDLPDFVQQFPDAGYEEQFGQASFRIPAGKLGDVFTFLKNHPTYPMEMLVDITAVDYLSSDFAERPNLTGREEDKFSETRFDVVYHFYCLSKNKRIRVVTSCGGEEPSVISCYAWWQAAHFLEREVWDMFGIKFTGHPDLRRILLYEEFEGHPLRKDYPILGEQPRVPLRNPERENA